MHDVKKAQYLSEYKLLLTFDDGIEKEVDFNKLLEGFEGPIFRPLKDINYFKTFSINDDIGTVCWPNDADVCPDLLYDKGKRFR